MAAAPMAWNDFNGDGRSDLATYQSTTGMWSVRDTATAQEQGIGWGGADQVPVAGIDFDGDRRADLAAYRPADGMWSIKLSSTGVGQAIAWGGTGQVPVGGVDFDGDGKTDLATYRTSDGVWSIRLTATGAPKGIQWGGSDQLPVGGVDFDGDGKTDLASYRTSDGMWSIRLTATGLGQGIQWGGSEQTPVGAVDFDGDRRTDLASYRTSDGTWSIRSSATGRGQAISWGGADQTPIGGVDYDGDGKTDLTSYRQRDGAWSMRRTANAQGVGVSWGGYDQVPIGLVSSTSESAVPSKTIANARLTPAAGTTPVSPSHITYGVPISGPPGSLKFVASGVSPISGSQFSLGSLSWFNATTKQGSLGDSFSTSLKVAIKLGNSPAADVVVPLRINSTLDQPGPTPDTLTLQGLPRMTFKGPIGKDVILQVLGFKTTGPFATTLSLNEQVTATYELMAILAPATTEMPAAWYYEDQGLLAVDGTNARDVLDVRARGNSVEVVQKTALGVSAVIPITLIPNGPAVPHTIVSAVDLAVVKQIRMLGYGGPDDLVSSVNIMSMLYGGPGSDTLVGGPVADRILWEPGDNRSVRVSSNDALIQFVGGDAAWNSTDILKIDTAFAILQNYLGNTRLLKRPDGEHLTFIRVHTIPGVGIRGYNYNTGDIAIADRAFSYTQPAWTTALHEIAHNWDYSSENPDIEDFWATFGWESDGGEKPKWIMTQPDFGFVSSYAQEDADEDFAETLKSLFFRNSEVRREVAPLKVRWVRDWLERFKS